MCNRDGKKKESKPKPVSGVKPFVSGALHTGLIVRFFSLSILKNLLQMVFFLQQDPESMHVFDLQCGLLCNTLGDKHCMGFYWFANIKTALKFTNTEDK